MEEITKELGHRPSVSMPSLDATDDFSAESVSTENTNTVFATTESTFISTASTETVGVSSEGSDALSSNAMSFTSTDSALQENVDTSCVEEASEATLIDQVVSEPLIQQQSDVLQAEGLDDPQGDEDPSAAIDQFIKKIADEQLSSKRIEERKEEDAIEQKQQIESHGLSLSTDNDNRQDGVVTMTDSTPILQEENIPQDVEANNGPQLNETTEVPVLENVQPMEVGVDENAQVSSQNNVTDTAVSEEHMQAESIEEIQKEIDKIPPKKTTEEGQKAPAKQEENGDHVTESIEDILEDKIDKKVIPGEILKSALEKQNKSSSTEDSLEVAKDSVLIEKAQEEVKKLDVLVCGGCHNTFYFVQDFSDHKKGKCSHKSSLAAESDNDSKPQVWGFILWKIKQTKDAEENTSSVSAWSIYQRWCKLPQADKIAWITAGQSIQFASKLGNAKITEVKPGVKAKTPMPKVAYEAASEFVDSNKENSSKMQEELRKGISKPVKLNNDVTILPSTKTQASSNVQNTNVAVRSTKVLSSAQKDEFVVEKIMAKRFNPRKKTWEYNIKWENFDHDSNTWEPVSNLSHCKKMLDQFEEQLKRMKEEKAKQTQSPKGRGRPPNVKQVKVNSSPYIPIAPKLDASLKISNVVGGVSDDYSGSSSGNRPQRSSKQKALSQVKQWCGSISDEESVPTGFKRKHSDLDSDEDYDDKKIKMEEDSDDSDKALKTKGMFKKISTPKLETKIEKQSPTKNGAQQILPSNILIPDANGVVRINQKQLPSLSSGVYIMSKTAGIIKLDSTTSKVATSGGQTIVKVAPKIGQTQIKIVKKDGTTTKQVIQVSPKVSATSTPVKVTPVKSSPLPKSVSSTPKMRPQVKKPPALETPKLFTKKIDPVPTPTPPPKPEPAKEEESDDGLEPLPFPDVNDPIPEVEEAQDENFELDPFTGKLAGVEYVDKPVVIKEEPQPQPPTTNELENIVKIAAAEISKDELVEPSQDEEDPLFTAPKEVKKTAPQTPVKAETSQLMRKVVKYTVKDGVRTETTVLNKSAGVQPRAIISPVRSGVPQQRPRPTQQKVINQMVSRPVGSMGTTKTVVRHVIGPQKPGGNLNVVRKTITQQTVSPRSRFNLTPQKPLPSPLQPNRTYSPAGIRPQGPSSKVQVYSKPSSMGRPGIQQNPNRNTMVRSSSSTQIQTTQRTQSGQLTSTPKPVTRIVQRVVTSPKKPDNQTVLNRSLAQKARPVINMPSLTDEDLPLSPTKQPAKVPVVSQAQKSVVTAEKPEMTVTKTAETAVEKMDTSVVAEASAEQGTDWSSFTMADTENPIYITGDDGTIYQVAGQNEQGQTILITQGPDGQQQCLLVTNEIGELAGEEQPSTSTATTSADAAPVVAVATEANTAVVQESDAVLSTVATPVAETLQTPLQIKTDAVEMEAMDDDVQDQVVAQVVRAEPPSPGGTHKVVVMLPDGNLMVTQVSPEEYASLELE